MFKPIPIDAITVFLNLSQLHKVNAAVEYAREYLNQEYFYTPNKDVFFNEYAFKDGNLVYAVCGDGATRTEKNCTIVQRQFPNDVIRSCDITIRAHEKNPPKDFSFSYKIIVHAVGHENAALFWCEMGSHNTFSLMAINLVNCRTRMLYIADPNFYIYRPQVHSPIIVAYENEFEIFFYNLTSEHLPDGSSQVALRISLDREPQPIYSNHFMEGNEGSIWFISSFDKPSVRAKYVYGRVGMLRTSPHAVYLVKPNVRTKSLLVGRSDYFAGISVNDNAITSCAIAEIDSQTECTQFDADGNVKLNVTLYHEDKYLIKRRAVYNSPRGGFLMMTASFTKLDEWGNLEAVSYDVIRIDGKGKKVGIFLDRFVDGDPDAKVFSIWDDGEEYCAALVGQMPRHQMLTNNLYIYVTCFGEEEFTM